MPGEKILQINIHEEVKSSFMDYAMSVIVSRALPDVRDGLKPVHRRILYAMSDLGMTPDKPHKKSARLVGEVLGKYHPHGDAAVYDAMVRLAQDFSSRYPLVNGHGNFGSVDGDSAAAMRYTEVKLSALSMQMLADINKETVDFIPNFDESLEEPKVLPSRFPNLLVNGSSGIAVGMATNIPPHNLTEVIDALEMLIDNPEVSLSELMLRITGPDFPTGGIIMGREGIKNAYTSGRGTIKIRARAEIDRNENGKSMILITELPYQVNKSRLVEKIADLVRDKKIEGITDLRDESDRNGIRIVIELRRDTVPQLVLNKLYRYTQLEDSFGIILLALVNNQPMVLNLKQILENYLEHQKDVVTLRTRYDLRKAEDRMHIVEGLRIALDYLDRIITLIRGSKDPATAREGLIREFSLTEKQAQAILDMRLQKLTGLERTKLEEEYAELARLIESLKQILNEESVLLNIIREELMAVKEKFGDYRRTDILADADEITAEDLIKNEQVSITITNAGYIKRMPLTVYRNQRRGGRGAIGIQTREEDFVEAIFITSTLDNLICFSNKGKAYRLRVYEIPEAGRAARGTNLVNLLPLESGEYVAAAIPIREFRPDHYLLMCTIRGIVKRVDLSRFANIRVNGIKAIVLDEEDELVSVKQTKGVFEVMLAASSGNIIRFHEQDVRPMGRAARGVKGMNLSPGELVISMDLDANGDKAVLVTENGFGKRVPLKEFSSQRRGGKGLKAIKLSKTGGPLKGFKIVASDDELIIITAQGVTLRQFIKDVPQQGRYSRGVKMIRLDKGDKVSGMARIKEEALEED